MKHLLLTTIAAVLVVGCGESQPPEPPTAKAPDISISLTGGRMAIRFQAHPGNTYSLHTCDDLASGKWIKLEANEFVTKVKAVEFVVSPDNGEGQRFYRVSRTSSSRSGSVSSLGGTRTTRAVPTRARRTYPAPPPMEGGDPVVQALEMMQQKDLAVSKGVPMPPLPFQQQTQPEPTTPKAPDISIHQAVFDGNIEAVKQHLAAGTDVNAKSENGVTPLHWAVGGGRNQVAELLIANGADVNAKDNDGWTPLRVARTKEIAELLIAKGADVNAKLGNESTPLHYAAIVGQTEIVELLIANGADVNAKSEIHVTPLDEAIKYKRTETADLLRKHGGKTGEELKAEAK